MILEKKYKFSAVLWCKDSCFPSHLKTGQFSVLEKGGIQWAHFEKYTCKKGSCNFPHGIKSYFVFRQNMS